MLIENLINLGADQGKRYNHEVTFDRFVFCGDSKALYSRSLSRGSCEVVPQKGKRTRELSGEAGDLHV